MRFYHEGVISLNHDDDDGHHHHLHRLAKNARTPGLCATRATVRGELLSPGGIDGTKEISEINIGSPRNYRFNFLTACNPGLFDHALAVIAVAPGKYGIIRRKSS